MRCQENILSENFTSKKKIMKRRSLSWEINSRELKMLPAPPYHLTILTVCRKGEEMSTEEKIREVKR